MNLQEILDKEKLSLEEIDFLVNLSSKEDLDLLFRKSLGIKNLYLGRYKNKIASIEFSNYCENNCLYCNLREEGISTERFRRTPEEILNIISCVVKENITNIILQSGSDSYYDTDMISYLIYRIKKDFNLEITLDLVQRGFDEYRAWKFAGADNYLLKFNTANDKNYSLFNENNNLNERINHIKYLKRLGYKICTGNIIGLPYQTNSDITNDLMLLNTFKPEMILNSPFIPQKFTKYQNWNKADFILVQKTTAISRLLLKKSDILVPESRDMYLMEEKKKLFNIGANTLVLEYYRPNQEPYNRKIQVSNKIGNSYSSDKLL